MTRHLLIFVVALSLAVPAVAAEPDRDLGIHDIMTPEPGTRPERPRNVERPAKPHKPPKKASAHKNKKKRARGSSSIVYPTPLPPPLHYVPPPSHPVVTNPPAVPPPMYVPQTGRVLPNLPAPVGSGPNGTETYQDRALRCAHQSGVYGSAAGNRNAYIGGCVTQ